MKEIFYSEILNKYFESKKECTNAELQYQLDKQEAEKKKQAEETAKKEAIAAASKEKKELSKAIEDADYALSEAYNNYELKLAETKKLTEEYNKKIEELINPAKEAIKKAQQEKYQAISNYNNKYGTYSVVYTGNKAYDEFKRASDMIDKAFRNFLFF